MKKKIVLLRSPVLSQTGYGVHSRQIANWLLSKEDLDVRFHALEWGNSPWIVDQTRCDGLISKVFDKTVDSSFKGADLSIQVQMPYEWNENIAPVNIGVTAGVETDLCNPRWIPHLNKMNRVVVPSAFAKKTLVDTGKEELKAQIDVIHESYTEVDNSKISENLFTFSTPFNFLIFGQLTGGHFYNDRKNTFFALKWLIDLFKDDPEVGIVIKTNSGRNSIKDRFECKKILNEVISQFRVGPFPKVHLIHGELNDEDVFSLYRNPSIKALVTASRGEGYGLPILEAASQDLPVIATNWSGHLEFLNSGKFIKLDYDLKEVHKSKLTDPKLDKSIFIEGQKWAEVNEEDFKRKVKKFRSAPETPREWAKDLGLKIREKFSFEKICAQYDQILGEYLK
jgi:glycosyltransferase involved in cell wall biosynthesis